jgi:hypothetical protein
LLIGWGFPGFDRLLAAPVEDGVFKGLIVNTRLVALQCGVVVNGGDVEKEAPVILEEGIVGGLDLVSKVVETFEESVVPCRVSLLALNCFPNFLRPVRDCLFQASVVGGRGYVLLGCPGGHWEQG